MLCKEWGFPGSPLLIALVTGFGLIGAVQAEEETQFGQIQWRTSYADAAKEAVAANKPILIEITAVWCSACRQMQQLTFSNRRIMEQVDAAYIPLVIDADKHSDLVTELQITAFPTTLVVAPDLKIIKRFTGFQSASTLQPELEQIINQHFKGTSQDDILPVSALRPSNATRFAFEGFCLVGILEDQKLRRGKPEFTTIYKDQEVCFHSEEHLKRFLANPTKYWPVANGNCLVSERDGQELTLGDPRLGVTWCGRLWLFSDREHQRRFIESPLKYAAGGI